MGLGTKHRQQQTADTCKEYLREKHKDKGLLVNEFIAEIEGTGKAHDIARWSQFADLRDVKSEMLERLESHFEKWLNP